MKLGRTRNRALAKSMANCTAICRYRRHWRMLDVLEPRVLLSGYLAQDLASFNDAQFGSYLLRNDGTVYGIASGNPETIFRIDGSSGVLTTIGSFAGFTPFDGNFGTTSGSLLVMDAAGDLFGTLGFNSESAVYELPHGTNSPILIGTLSGATSELTIDGGGNIYGATRSPGAIFEIPAGSASITILATPSNFNPNSSLVVDQLGDVYGTAYNYYPSGESNSQGEDVLFELPAGSDQISVLATAPSIGQSPNSFSSQGGLVLDNSGNIYGMLNYADYGGTSYSYGAIFELPHGSSQINILASLTPAQGGYPYALLIDSEGNLFGSTVGGGGSYPYPTQVGTTGVVFELPKGSSTVQTLYIPNNNDYCWDLAMDGAGNLYGLTANWENFYQIKSIVPSFREFKLTPAQPSQMPIAMVFTQEPYAIDSAGEISPAITVQIVDQNYQVVTNDNSTVTISILGGTTTGTLTGTLSVPVNHGVATFDDLSLTPTSGTYILEATDATDNLAVTSNQFRLLPSTDSIHLGFTQVTSNSPTGSTITPAVVVALEDQNGNTHTGSAHAILLTINSGPSDSTLDGTVVTMTVNGVATFDDLTLNDPGTYTLSAFDLSDGFMATSAPFVVGPITAAPPVTDALGPGDSTDPGPTILTLTPTFSWDYADGATGYGLYIKDMSTGVLVYPNANGNTRTPLTDNPFTLPTGILLPGHQYDWYMTSFSGDSESSASIPRYFQTSPPATTFPVVFSTPTFLRHVFPGYKFGAPIQFTNGSSGLAKGTATITYYLSSTPQVGTSATQLLRLSNQSIHLTVGQSQTFGALAGQQVTIPRSTIKGAYYLIVVVTSSVTSATTVSPMLTVEDPFGSSKHSGDTAAARASGYIAAALNAKSNPAILPEVFSDSAAQQFIKNNEGARDWAYLDSLEVPTIGVGLALQDRNAQGKLVNSVAAERLIASLNLPYTFDQLVKQAHTNTPAHHVDALSEEDIDDLMTATYGTAKNNAMSAVSDFAQLSPDVEIALIDMSFNLGLAGLQQFTIMISDLDSGDILSAAYESMNSLRAIQVKKRAAADFRLFVTGSEADL